MAANQPSIETPARGSAAQASTTVPTVIIPVYGDFAATKACLDSLLKDPGCGDDFRIVIVEDGSPDRAIAQYLDSLAGLPFVELIVNNVNLGFVGSINRALERITDGDVVLLNADTIVPPGFVDRLRLVARGATDIGTVVPLSNSSGISDFPIPHHSNALGCYEEVVELDRLALKANRDLVIDVANGTGFCLYITRACLDAVGHLAETFQRGYLEDVDFCLRAREKGFRNVCAPSVYVGHAGSRSFGSAKRALVMKNLSVLDHRFPTFRSQSRSFALADPLCQARINIERLLAPTARRPVLIVASAGTLWAAAELRAAQLARQKATPILVASAPRKGWSEILLRSADEGSPQSLRFAISSAAERAALARHLQRLKPLHCEVFETPSRVARILALLADLSVPFDLYAPYASPAEAIEPSGSHTEQALFESARSIIVPSKSLAPAAATDWPDKVKVRKPPVPKAAALRGDHHADPGRAALTVIPLGQSAAEFTMVRQLSLALIKRRPDTEIFVAGTTLDDSRLMAIPNVFVSGAVALNDLPGLLSIVGCANILVLDLEAAHVWHPVVTWARAAARPVGYVDWSRGVEPARSGDLAIPPEMPDARRMEWICAWMEGA